MFNPAASIEYSRIRPEILEAMNRYGRDRIPAGDFLMAVFENDLMEALGRADEGNRATIWEICLYVYNEMPSSCHGSPQKVEEWTTPQSSLANESP